MFHQKLGNDPGNVQLSPMFISSNNFTQQLLIRSGLPLTPDFLRLKFGSPIDFFWKSHFFSVIRSRYGGLLNLL